MRETVYNITLQGLKKIAAMTTMVLEQTAYKFRNPAANPAEAASPDALDTAEVSVYELAVRCNYTSEEKHILVVFISMIKNLSALLQSYLSLIQEIVDHRIYEEIQLFSRSTVTDYYAHAHKKKKTISPVLLFIRDATLDGPADEEAATKGVPQHSYLKNRADPISQSQLHFARSMIDFCTNEKSKGLQGGFMKEKTLKENQVVELQKFFIRSFYFPWMINLSETIRECSDLSNIWFREFYLELSKQIQFPINTSLPWTLTEFALEAPSADLMGLIFYPLDLYNDSAHRTLRDLKSRVIFDEIEAEVNLCFDQFIFKLSNRVFQFYKKMGGLRVLPADMRVNSSWVPPNNQIYRGSYEFILHQTDLQLLGRSINVSKIMAEMFNKYFRQSVDVAITRFEMGDIQSVFELESLIETNRITHQMLSEHVILEKFDDIVAEVDEAVSINNSRGRIVTHVLETLMSDLVVNFSFNTTTQR